MAIVTGEPDMPIVYEVSASYRRTVQPKDYESATAEISLKSQFEEGDQIEPVAAELLDTCKRLTLTALSKKPLVTKGEGAVGVDVKDVAEVPKKSGKTRQVSETPEDREEIEDELPEETEPAKKPAKKPAAKKKEAPPAEEETEEDDDYDASAFDETKEEAEIDEISAKDLQQYITGNVSEKLISVGDAKDIMARLGDGAIRVSAIPDGQRNDVYAAVKEIVEATRAKRAKAAKK